METRSPPQGGECRGIVLPVAAVALLGAEHAAVNGMGEGLTVEVRPWPGTSPGRVGGAIGCGGLACLATEDCPEAVAQIQIGRRSRR